MKLIYGKGINDMVGISKNPAYRKWISMLSRCYSENTLEKSPTYRGVTVCDEWLTFSVFNQWYNDHYVEGWDLDKDLLTDDRKYSPDTCIFVPRVVNTFVGIKSMGKVLPTGVFLHRVSGKYQSLCTNPFTKKLEALGLYETVWEAREAYLETKLLHALELKEEMDAIDERIFPRIVESL